MTESTSKKSKKTEAIDALRISVFRSNNFIYAQAIDDKTGRTLAAVSSKNTVGKKSKTDSAFACGEMLAKKINNISYHKISFDRNGYKYHGRVKALAEGARALGLKF